MCSVLTRNKRKQIITWMQLLFKIDKKLAPFVGAMQLTGLWHHKQQSARNCIVSDNIVTAGNEESCSWQHLKVFVKPYIACARLSVSENDRWKKQAGDKRYLFYLYQAPVVPHPVSRSSPLIESVEQATPYTSDNRSKIVLPFEMCLGMDGCMYRAIRGFT